MPPAMAGHEWDWFQREELIGQISDIRVQNLQVERENVQKRTFTRWINLHLEKCAPPLEVTDLFADIQDGRILMALLEVLTGQSLLHEYKPSSHRIFRLNNIAKALKFLEDSNVKLVSIDAAEIADGNPALVLGLIWNIILFLQIKELTGNLNRMSSSSSLSSLPSGGDADTSHPSTPGAERGMSVSIRDQRRTIKALLNWVQQRTRKYGVAVQDFAGSWRSGLAFLAIIKAIDFRLVDMKKALERSPRENLEDAFSIAQRSLHIPRLLEPEDVMVASPDEHSIMTYVSQFLEHFPELDPDDLAEQNEDAPLEMTYVRYRDGPTEEEGKIITVSGAEDEGFTVQLQTRPLTPPQTHNYAEVHIPEGEKINLEKSQENPFQVPEMKGDAPNPAALKLNNVLQRLERSPRRSDVNGRRSPAGLEVIHSEEHDGGLRQTNDSITKMNGKNAPVEADKWSSLLQQHELEVNDGRQTPSSFSSMVIDSPEVNQTHMASKIKPSPEGREDTYPYVLHQPTDPSKQLTVFQAYKASEQDSRVQSSDSEPEEVDSTSPPKISIIPHDLFYYPHYSVPIADVLQAFADTCPDSLLEQTFTFEASSEEQTGDNETLSSGVYLDTESTASDTSMEEPQEMMVGVEDLLHSSAETGPQEPHEIMLGVEDLLHSSAETGPQEPLVRSLANGSISAAPYDVSSGGCILRPGYPNTFQDDDTDSSDEEWREERARREGFLSRRVDSDDDEDFLEDEDQADEHIPETEDLWMSRDVQESGAHKAVDVGAPAQTNFGANVNGGGRLGAFGREGPHEACGRLAEDSSRALSGRRPLDSWELLVVLWLLCYFLLIFPELDLSKVAFFVESE